MHADIVQAEKSLTPMQPQATTPPTPKTPTTSDSQPQPRPKRPTAELMEELRKAQANGKSVDLPVNANGKNIEEIMKELAGNVLQEAMPDLMQQMGAADRNPIMQVPTGMSPLTVGYHDQCLASYFWGMHDGHINLPPSVHLVLQRFDSLHNLSCTLSQNPVGQAISAFLHYHLHAALSRLYQLHNIIACELPQQACIQCVVAAMQLASHKHVGCLCDVQSLK